MLKSSFYFARAVIFLPKCRVLCVAEENVCYLCSKLLIYTAFAVKNIQTNLIFIARLCVFLSRFLRQNFFGSLFVV